MSTAIAICVLCYICGAVSEFPPYCTDTFPSEIERIKYKVINESVLIPELIRTLPQQICKVTYPSGHVVDMGNTLNKTETNETPIVEWNAEKDKLYLLILVNADCPGPKYGTLSPYMHWMVVNIPGNNVTAGHTLFEYIGLLSPPRTDWHRYVFLIYEQRGKTYYKVEGEYASIRYRGPIYIDEMQYKYRLIGPIAINYFVSKY